MFQDELRKRNLEWVLDINSFYRVLPKGSYRFLQVIKDVVDRNERIYIDGDCDIDGYMSALCFKLMFDTIGYSNYEVTRHSYKRHQLSKGFVTNNVINRGFRFMIIVDSSSNSKELIQYLNDKGVFVVVIDHHTVKYRRSEFNSDMTIMINPHWDEQEEPDQLIFTKFMSAGALSSLIVDASVKILWPQHYSYLYNWHLVYGYITLYSDCCKFNSYNVAYAKYVTALGGKMPPIVQFFMTEWDILSKNFVSFKFAPRVNALIRTECWDIVWELFYNFPSFIKKYTLESIDTVYLGAKNFLRQLISSAKNYDLNNLRVVILPALPKARNFTGLVSNEISGQCQKPVLTLVLTAENYYEGSIRDLYNRDVLSVFQQVCCAQGHKSAFGVKFPNTEFQNIVYYCNDMMESFQYSQEPIILNWELEFKSPKALEHDFMLMSTYNEYAGGEFPLAYGLKTLTDPMVITNYEKRSVVTWGNYQLVSFSTLVPDVTALIEPTKTTKGSELIIQSTTTLGEEYMKAILTF